MPRRPHAFALAAAGAMAITAALWSGGARPSTAQETDGAARDTRVRPQTRLVPQRQWEYMQLPCMASGPGTTEREREERLNEQGKRGWELVSLLELEHPPGRGCLLATFKRQVLN